MNPAGLHTPFSSFLWAGYECTAARTEKKFRLDMTSATKHNTRIREDYRLLSEIHIRTVREGFAWSRIDLGHGHYDFSYYLPFFKAAVEMGIEQVWDLNHFDYPDYLDPYSKEFPLAFAAYALQAYRQIREYQKQMIYIVPVNEISFSAWIGADKGWWAPFKRGRKNGFRYKSQLVRASILAMEAIMNEDRDVRFIQVDPFMRRLNTSAPTSKSAKHCREFNEIIRFEAWDMLSGKTYPQLGGKPEFLDIVGVNYYLHNQEWVSTKNGKLVFKRMGWNSKDRVPFGSMLREIYTRYGRPMVVTETGSYGAFRPSWWQRILGEIHAVRDEFPVWGVCAYPVLDRPNWTHFLVPESGLFDFDQLDPDLKRHPHKETIGVILQRSTL